MKPYTSPTGPLGTLPSSAGSFRSDRSGRLRAPCPRTVFEGNAPIRRLTSEIRAAMGWDPTRCRRHETRGAVSGVTVVATAKRKLLPGVLTYARRESLLPDESREGSGSFGSDPRDPHDATRVVKVELVTETDRWRASSPHRISGSAQRGPGSNEGRLRYHPTVEEDRRIRSGSTDVTEDGSR